MIQCRAKFNQLFISQRKNEPTFLYIAEPAAIWDSSRPIAIGQARWLHVCTSKQEVVGLNPTRVACEVFSTDTRKALSIQCYTHVGVGHNEISCLSPDARINQPIYLWFAGPLYRDLYHNAYREHDKDSGGPFQAASLYIYVNCLIPHQPIQKPPDSPSTNPKTTWWNHIWKAPCPIWEKRLWLGKQR